jgi:ankyrin repeat and fibronectin type-III domain-containing protein 1
MEKKTTSAIHFRTKLLTAIYQMQSALGITDLGQFYHKPLKDSHGTVVLSCILNVKVSFNLNYIPSRFSSSIARSDISALFHVEA